MTKQWHVLIVASDKRNRGWFGQISLNARSLNMQQPARAFVVSARVKGLDTPSMIYARGTTNVHERRGNGSITRGAFLQALSRAVLFRRACVRVCFNAVSCTSSREIGISRLSRPNDQALARCLNGEGETHMSNFQATWHAWQRI